MDFKKWMKRKRILWHNHFIPSLIAAVVVAVLSFLYNLTISNIILFASVGASAIILTNTRSHHLFKLKTIITAYFIAIIISSLVYLLNTIVTLHTSINLFLLIFLVGFSLFLFDASHPPAIASSISFILLDRPLIYLIYLFFAIMMLLVILRFITYVASPKLSIKDFYKEFKKLI